MWAVCLAKVELWLGAGEGTLSMSVVVVAKWELLEVIEVVFPEVNE